ncbi:MAG: transglutaminase domain-containing protein, partial [bacterium]|nr:transglutaminase domain-containing protein [bacterium]
MFGYESLIEKRSVFSQFEHQFQGELPVLVSRFVLELPDGWRVEPFTFNSEEIVASSVGSTFIWRTRDLGPILDETARPPVTALAPRLAVTCYPAAEGKPAFGPVFRDWQEVARWLSRLNDSEATLDAQLRRKARELTDGAESEAARIQAIASFVQNIRYVSIQMGIERGGGYTPHSASEVLRHSYGDCKDKATLMRALLAGVGVESFPVAIFSGDSRYVRPEWPSPHQFNHQIVAVKVSR